MPTTVCPCRMLFTVFASLVILVAVSGNFGIAQVTPDCQSGHCQPPGMDRCAPLQVVGSVTAPSFWFGSDAEYRSELDANGCQGWPKLHHYICASPHDDLIVVWDAAAINHGTGRALSAGKCVQRLETVRAFTLSDSIIRYTQRSQGQGALVFIASHTGSQSGSVPVHSGLVTSVSRDGVRDISVHIATLRSGDTLEIVITASPSDLIIGLGSLGSMIESQPNDGILVAQVADFVEDRFGLPDAMDNNNAVFVERLDFDTTIPGNVTSPGVLGDRPTNSWSRNLNVPFSALSIESNVAPLFVLDTDRRLITWSRYTIWLPTD